MPDAEQRDDRGMAAGLGQETLARIDEQYRQIGVDAPVAMLRVYCSWPGVSAMMNERRGRRDIAIGDVDRDSLLALGFEPVDEQRESRCRRRSVPCLRESRSERGKSDRRGSADVHRADGR